MDIWWLITHKEFICTHPSKTDNYGILKDDFPGTAHTRLVIQATEDVYQTTRQKLILAEEKNNENQTVMIDFKNKRKLQSKKTIEGAKKAGEIASSSSSKTSGGGSSKASQK